MNTTFLQAIIENPDDLAPRLIYADWLDEHGDTDQAEFIRLQCTRGTQADPLPREMELLDRHWRDWALPILRILPHLSREDIHFRHGVPFRITFRRAADVEFLPAIMNAAPIRELDLDFDGNERVLRDHRRFCDQFFVDSEEHIPMLRRVHIRSEQEQRRLDELFDRLLNRKEI